MPNLPSKIALLALAGLMAATPVYAAPPSGPNNNSSTQPTNNGPIDCSLPMNAKLPFCIDLLKNKGPNGNKGPMNGGQTDNNGQNSNQGFNPPGQNGGPHNPPPNYQGPKSGSFNWNQQDRNFFHQRFNFGGFGNFSFFLTPNFSITIGTSLPNTYHSHLKRVPYSVYHVYPWFRGYYFFIDRRGDFVIVSPRTFKIVAVL